MDVLDVSRSLLRDTYEKVLAKWPEVITPGAKTFHLGGGCNMRALNEIHSPIDDWSVSADFEDGVDEIISSVEHYLFVCIHDALRNLTQLRKADVDFEAFASRFDGHPNFRVVD